MPDVALLSVMIADDSEPMRRRLRELLEALAFAELRGESISADGVIELMGSDLQFDVVILDIQMPGSGVKALRHLNRHHPDVQVVMLTNHADAFYERVCKQAGAAYFLDKSMAFDQVPGVLEAIALGNAGRSGATL